MEMNEYESHVLWQTSRESVGILSFSVLRGSPNASRRLCDVDADGSDAACISRSPNPGSWGRYRQRRALICGSEQDGSVQEERERLAGAAQRGADPKDPQLSAVKPTPQALDAVGIIIIVIVGIIMVMSRADFTWCFSSAILLYYTFLSNAFISSELYDLFCYIPRF